MYRVLFAVLGILWCSLVDYAEAQILATAKLEYPVSSDMVPLIKRGPLDGYLFLEATDPKDYPKCSTGVFHPGWDMNVDVDNDPNTGGNEEKTAQLPVYAIADGIVRVVWADANGHPQKPDGTPAWNGVVIEHNIGGQRLYSCYGHMQHINVFNGQSVTAGVTQVGVFGDVGALNKAHLHLEIRKETHPELFTPTSFRCDKQTDGTESLLSSSWVSTHYYHPEDLINGVPVIGRRRGGPHPKLLLFVAAYLNAGATATLGRVWDNGPGDIYVHYWPSVEGNPDQPLYPWSYEFQDFLHRNDSGTPGNSSDDVYTWNLLVRNPSSNQVYAVKDAMRNFWKKNPGIGAPTSNEYTVQAALIRQDFQSGYLTRNGSNPVTPYNPAGQQVPTRFVNFTSTPSVAGIYSDDVLIGYTPFSAPLYQGFTYAYTAKLLGYQNVTQEFTVGSQDMTVNFTLQGTGLSNPYGLHLVDRTTNQMTIAWNYNGNLSNTGFKLYTNGGSPWYVGTGTLSWIVYGLSPNTTYQFFVTTVQNGLESGPSNTITESTLPEPTEFPVKLKAELPNDFPTRYGTNPHPEGGLGFSNSGAYAQSKLISFSATGRYKFEVVAKRAYSNTRNQYLACTITNNGDGGIWDQLPTQNTWSHFSKVWEKRNLGNDLIVLQANGDLSDGWPVCIDSAMIYYLGPLPPVLAVDSTALHFGSVDTARTFGIKNTGGPGLNWQCSSSHPAVVPNPSQGAGNYTAQVVVRRGNRQPGSYTDNVTVASNGGTRIVLVYYTVPITMLLTNGSFESDWIGWVVEGRNVSKSISLSGAKDGMKYARVTAMYSSTTLSQSGILVTAGVPYELSFWSKNSFNRRSFQVSLVSETGTTLASASFSTNWQWSFYKTTLKPSASGKATLRFSLARYTTDIDGIELKRQQVGKTAYSDEPVEFPRSFALYQNYPNPFNPVTTFRFDLPEAAHVTLAVYNMVGQIVATLTDAVWEAGAHSVAWDASRLSSGIYFYTLEAGEKFRATRKFLLMK